MSEYYSKHFKKSEFACHCGKCEYSKDPKMNRELITVLELIRAYCKSINPKSYVFISSGRRCKEHNAKEGGRPRSKHLYGLAADIKTRHVPLADVFNYINTLFPDCFGLSLYSNFIHIDARKGRGRW